MKTYEMVDVWFDGYFLYLMISHEPIAKALQAAVREKISGAHMKLSDDYWMFEHLNGKDREMFVWILGWLGDNSFEPYATSQHDKVSGYCFRRGVNKVTTVSPFAR